MQMKRYSILGLPAAAAAIIAAAPAHAQTGAPGVAGDGAAGVSGAPSYSADTGLVGSAPTLAPGSIVYNYANLIPDTVNNWLNLVPNSLANWSAIFTGQPVPYPGSAVTGSGGTSFYGPTSLERSAADATRLQTLANAGLSGYNGLGY